MPDDSLERGSLDPGYEPHQGSVWITEHWSTLPKDQWVAAKPSGKIASDPTFDGLLTILKAKHVDPGDVAIAFIAKDEM